MVTEVYANIDFCFLLTLRFLFAYHSTYGLVNLIQGRIYDDQRSASA